MTSCTVLVTRTAVGFASQCAVLLILMSSSVSGHTQESLEGSFLAQFNTLMDSSQGADIGQVDSAVSDLLDLNNALSGTYDSLIPTLLIWHYKRKSGDLSGDDRIELLNHYRSLILHLGTVGDEDLAEFYALYITAFRARYQSDSVARYLDLVEFHLGAIEEPSEVKLHWFFDKGRFAFSQSDYEASLTFFQRGLEYVDRFFPEQLRFKYVLVNAIGIGYRRTEMADEAIAHYEYFLQRHGEDIDATKLTGAFLNNLGLAYKDNSDWGHAIRRMKSAIAYYQQYFSSTYEDIGSGYDNIALCYKEQGRLDSALIFSQKSLEFIRQNVGTRHPDLLLPMGTITRTLIQAGKLEEAVAMNAEAQAFLTELGWSADDPSGDYYLADAFDVHASSEYIHRAFFDRTSDTAHLIRAIAAGTSFMTTTDYAYDNLKNDLSKEIFRLRYGDVFSACVDDLYALYEINNQSAAMEQAFAITEKFKSLELLYAAQKDKADKIQRYQILNDDYNAQIDSIRFYRTQYETNDRLPDPAAVLSKLNSLKEALYLWKERTRQNYPDYYQLIYHPEPLSIKELQHTLEKTDQCILSYHVSDHAIYMFVITEDTAHFVKHDIDLDLSLLISSFRQSIYAPYTDSARTETAYIRHSERFKEHAYTLYQFLVAPVHRYLSERVVIIVDKSLGYVPFDLLITDPPEVAYRYRDHAYLLHKHAISYSYSAQLWMDMRQHKYHKGPRLLAMAPDFPETDPARGYLTGLREGLSRLYYNDTEVRQINEVIPGLVLLGGDASREHFLRYSPDYAIIHLATHSKANDEQGDYSFLAFADTPGASDKLLASEIYNLSLKAELVTLSACETGLGELKSGEGIISLARAFSFAGAKSIVSSLWSVNDKSTPSIMTAFYQNIRRGLPKDIALQRAKQAFVLSRGHADAHPFFWGGFICVGDMRPMLITDHPSSKLLWGLIALAGAMMLFLIIRNVRRDRVR